MSPLVWGLPVAWSSAAIVGSCAPLLGKRRADRHRRQCLVHCEGLRRLHTLVIPSLALEPVSGLIPLIVTAGSVSSTANACVACSDWLPNWSVTCAVTVSVPSLSVVASAGGIVVVQPVPCAFTSPCSCA